MNLGDTVWWRHTADYLRVGTVTEVGDEQTAVKVDTATLHVSSDILLPVKDIPTGRWRGIPDTVYHRLPGLSASGAANFLFQQRILDQAFDPPTLHLAD